MDLRIEHFSGSIQYYNFRSNTLKYLKNTKVWTFLAHFNPKRLKITCFLAILRRSYSEYGPSSRSKNSPVM